jgi:hypothetical protein
MLPGEECPKIKIIINKNANFILEYANNNNNNNNYYYYYNF